MYPSSPLFRPAYLGQAAEIFPKIVYYGPRFKDSLEMHKNFVKPNEGTYEFEFPKFYGLKGAKAFYDQFFENLVSGEQEDIRDFVGMAPDTGKDELIFNSNFESGNLDMVVKTAPNTYDLFLRCDSNTKGHISWFYFMISNTKAKQTTKFNIVNLNKRSSLYQQGMKINYWSQRHNSKKFRGWQNGGTNLQYSRTKLPKEVSSINSGYTLSFDFTFDLDGDEVYLAYTVPYTYSMLFQYLKVIQEQ